MGLGAATMRSKEMWAWEPRSDSHGIDGSWVVENKLMEANRKHVAEVDFDKPVEKWKGGVEPGLVAVLVGLVCLE